MAVKVLSATNFIVKEKQMFQVKLLSQDVQMPQYLRQSYQVSKHFLDIQKNQTILTAVYQKVRITHGIPMF